MQIQNQLKASTALATPLDILLADVAIRIQLSNTDYLKATERYETIAVWIERSGSPLHGRLNRMYAQGSMSIGATIAKRVRTDEYDIDAIAELDFPREAKPSAMLDVLFDSIRGERGSKYYEMTTRKTRCVTVNYADNMHLDITPAVLLPEKQERTSFIFHSKPEALAEERSIIANPFGFAEWFKQETPLDHDFARLFEQRASAFGRVLCGEDAQVDDVPQQEGPHRKSKALIAHQLLKRWRNIKYDGRMGVRRPPSIVLAKLVADSAGQTETLGQELLFQAETMLELVESHHTFGKLIRVTNPRCVDDVFTDRWPENRQAQAVFLGDLKDLVSKLRRLNGGCDLAEMQAIMKDLFGEAPTGEVFRLFAERKGQAIAGGKAFHRAGSGQLDLVASGVTSGVASTNARSTPRHTFFGQEE